MRLLAAKGININRMKSKYLSRDFLGNALWGIIRTIIIVGISFMILYPFLTKIVASFMSMNDLLDPTVKYIPREPSLDFIRMALKSMNYYKTFINTFLLSGLVGMIQLFICSISAYGFARFKFRGRELLFAFVMLTLLIPPATTSISFFMKFKYFGIGPFHVKLVDSLWPFIILSLTGLGLKNGLYIYIMRQFFRGLPMELEQSAYIDGAGPFRTFLSIIIPNAIPMMMTVFLFSFTWQWTDTFYSTMFLSNFKVMALAIDLVISSNKQDPILYSTIRNTACFLGIIPLIIIYLFAQKHFVQSMERSGIVG